MTVLPSYLATFLASILLSVSLSTTAIIVEQYSPALYTPVNVSVAT